MLGLPVPYERVAPQRGAWMRHPCRAVPLSTAMERTLRDGWHARTAAGSCQLDKI